MKRSDAINEICDFIHFTRRATQAWTSMEISNKVLDILEKKIGMLPPHQNITGSKKENEYHIMNCQWAPEDK